MKKLNNDVTWQNYEEVSAYILNDIAIEFGLDRVEGKQSISGIKSGTSYEIDAKGIIKNNEGFVIIECRHHKKAKQNQEKIAALAYRIQDTGAKAGIIVSPLGIQSGALLIANAEKIINVILNQNCTKTEFSLSFLNKIFEGMKFSAGANDNYECEIIRTCIKCKMKFQPNQNEKKCKLCNCK